MGSLDTYLCTESDIETKSHKFSCSEGMDYYSYTNMINPMPCAEVLISAAYEEYPTSVKIPLAPWKPEEGFNSCMESYIGPSRRTLGSTWPATSSLSAAMSWSGMR